MKYCCRGSLCKSFGLQLSFLFSFGFLPRNEFNVSKGVDIINSINNKSCQVALQDEYPPYYFGQHQRLLKLN